MFLYLNWEGWGNSYNSYSDLNAPAWVSAPNSSVKVGAKLKRTWNNQQYTVKVISIFKGKMYKLHFDKLGVNSDLWIMQGDLKLKKQAGGG